MKQSILLDQMMPPSVGSHEEFRPSQTLGKTTSASSYLLALFIAFQISYVMKRAIFLVFDASQTVYYAVIALPIPFLIAALVLTKSRGSRKTWASAFSLWFLIVLGSLWTALSGIGAETLGTIFLAVAPLCGFFLGMTLRGRLPRPLVIAYLAAIIISVAYGVVQFFVGMTPLETAWANGTAAYSMQGTKALLGNIGEGLRPFSYFPDTMTWSAFLTGAGAIVWIGYLQGLIRKRTLIAAEILCLIGLFVCLSRSPFLVVAVAIAGYILLRLNLLRSAPVLCVVAIATSFVATLGSQYVIDNYSTTYNRFDDALENRYAAVGTLSVRAAAYDQLVTAVARYPLVGEGFAAKMRGSRALSEVEWLASHSMAVDAVVYWGAVGSMAYLVFLFSWFKQSTDTMALASDRNTRRVVMVAVAYVIGAIAEGQFSGLPVLPFEFYFVTGLVSGLYVEVSRKRISHRLSVTPAAPVLGDLSPAGGRVAGYRAARVQLQAPR
jgi:hypothetical protein